MPKTLLIIADGLSNSMLDLPGQLNPHSLSQTDLAAFFPGCLQYLDIWKEFEGRRHVSPAPLRGINATSAGASLMLSTGHTETLARFQPRRIAEAGLFSKCAERGIATAAVTNCPLTDSSIGMFLDPTAVGLYQEKTGSKNSGNFEMQCRLAEKLPEYPWDVLAGGGRWAFFDKSMEDPVTGEGGVRRDGLNLLEGLRRAEGIGLAFEDSASLLERKLDPGKRHLLLLHHNYFKFQAERPRVYAPEPMLGDLAMSVLKHLDTRGKDWFCVVESGRIDHAAHGNNLYFLVGEILELYRFLHLVRATPSLNECNVVLVSDHATGGLELRDKPGTVFDAFSSGASWGDGPGLARPDQVEFFRKPAMHRIPDFTPSVTSMPGLRAQPSAIQAKVASHNRSLVPCLFQGPALKDLRCDDFIGLHHVLAASLQLESPSREADGEFSHRNLVIVNGPPGSGKSTLSCELSARQGLRIVSGDDYLNGIAPSLAFGDEKLLLAVESMLFDAACILKHGEGVIVDFVFIDEPELILLERFLKKHGGDLIVLEVPPEEAMMRDLQRPPEDRMEERCRILSEQFIARRARFAELGAIFPDWRKPAAEIARDLSRRRLVPGSRRTM